MTAHVDSNSYERGLQLAESGRHVEALNCVREHLRNAPNDVEALNDAGAILHCLGRHNEAIGYLSRARNLRPDSGEVVWNLVEASLAAGKPTEVTMLFDAMQQMGILNVDVLNRTATQLLDQGKKGQAIDTLLRSYHRWPEQDILRSIVDIIRTKRPKVVHLRTSGSRDDSLADVWTSVEERFRTEFVNGFNIEEIMGPMSPQTIVWLDGGGPQIVKACERSFQGKVVVSLRRSDVSGDWVRQVRWENVDILVQVGSAAVEEALAGYVPDIRNRTRLVVLPYAVNLDRYALRQRPAGKNLACMGRLSTEANPGFLIQCVQKLHYIDSGFRLFLAGAFENALLEQYVHHTIKTLGLSDVVFLEPYPDDANAWLSDKHFIVSSGIGEGHVETILAGMATGVKPVVHNFPAAACLLPDECLFNISEEFCQRVLAADYEPARYRRFVEDRYPMQMQLKQTNSILSQLETEIELQSPPGAGESSISIPPIPVRQASESMAPSAMVGAPV
jgi:glycosyltransferase involved in cell wall biosynthesis